MAKLVKAVHVKDPDRNRTVLLLPGEEPEPRLAALITNPDAWEDGQVPDSADASDASTGAKASEDEDKGASGQDASNEAAPAAKKTAARKTAATSRSRGREAAGEGDSGE